MTVPTYPVPNPAPSRPLTVTFSSILLYVVVAMQLLSAVLVLSTMSAVSDAYQTGLDAEELGADVESVISFVFVAMAVIYAVIAIVLVVLAIFNNLGKNGARITTWVFGGLGLCCNAIGLGGSVAGTMVGGTSSSGLDEAQVEAEIEAALPGWYNGASTAVAVVTVLALLGAIILLALPQSNAFFRKPVAWNPAMPYPGYPPYQQGYQAYPQQPGYPQQPPSHFGTPAQYGQPGQPAPGLPPYPGQAGTPAPGTPAPSPEPSSDPWAQPPAAQPTAAQPPVPPPFPPQPPAPPAPSLEPSSDPWAAPPPAPPAPPALPTPPASPAPPASPGSGDDPAGDPPQRPV